MARTTKRLHKISSRTLGLAPGTIAVPEDAPRPVIKIMAYDRDNLVEETLENVADIPAYIKKFPVSWIDVTGLGAQDVIESFGTTFDLHILALEDVLNTGNRPKMEAFDSNLFVIARMAHFLKGKKDQLELEQVSFFLGKGFVISFQERPGDTLETVRDRIRKNSGARVRLLDADYLLYALIDAIVDGYYPVLERFGDILEDMEDEIVNNPTHDCIRKTHRLKRELQHLRHALWPMREVISGLIDDDMMSDKIEPYLRDCRDHIVLVLDMLETYRERSAGLIDIYLSIVGHKTNEVMKLLTVISTIFIPLGFIAGLYGMNFDTQHPMNLPELSSPIGYPVTLGVMAMITTGFLIYFKKLGWIGNKKNH
ncbi:MAG: magnesium/cobalt transporter CorA [Alphaproteobacteria bacterium]|nr:magnesium/cobalt transporter CorA [Alphaproteobacteria bacterium]